VKLAQLVALRDRQCDLVTGSVHCGQQRRCGRRSASSSAGSSACAAETLEVSELLPEIAVLVLELVDVVLVGLLGRLEQINVALAVDLCRQRGVSSWGRDRELQERRTQEPHLVAQAHDLVLHPVVILLLHAPERILVPRLHRKVR
jgi:hypothetical protein